MTIKELKEKHSAVLKKARPLAQAAKLDDGQIKELDSYNTELRSLSEQMDRKANFDHEAGAAIRSQGIETSTPEDNAKPFDVRSLSVGAFEVNDKQWVEVVKLYDEYSAVLNYADVGSPGRIITDHGNTMSVATITRQIGEQRAEGQPGSVDAQERFGSTDLKVNRYSSQVIPVTIEMNDDADFNVTGLVQSSGASAVAVAFDAAATGILTEGATAVARLDATKPLKSQDLVNGLWNGVSRFARRNPKVSMNSNTYYGLQTELDLNERPINSDWMVVARELLSKDNRVINDAMPNGTALVGNFGEAFYIRTMNGTRLQVIEKSAHITYELHMRAGVAIRNKEAAAFIS